ncbi:MAG: protein phosphatase CheZ, partial [Rhodocyclaceae bacterium]|nr:protein phosphatase CheZ [Rhodocyclaceae bacterium]
MSKRFRFDDSGDSDDLQALFDSIAAQPAGRPLQSPPRETHVEVVGGTAAAGDSPELEALFESVAGQVAAPAAKRAPAPEAAPAHADNVFQRLGHMTRQLHDTLRELGFDRALEEAAKAIPDARQRLAYVAQMTEQAASRVLNATDVAKPIQDKLQSHAMGLSSRWDRLLGGDLSVEEFKTLAADTHAYLKDVPRQTEATSEQLMEIMMAQDFQDLTGQVIKKIVELAKFAEEQLCAILVETTPPDRRAEIESGLSGPVVNAASTPD